jgi:pyrroloquinoline quinone (PQQ) biosynthesis protein C
MMSNPDLFLEKVRQMLDEGLPGRKHPFSKMMYEGRAARADLREFAKQTYIRNLYSSRFASANHSNCPIPEVRKRLLEVIRDEEESEPGSSPSHAQLMLKFGLAAGLKEEEVIHATPYHTTLTFVDTIMNLSRGHWLEGMAFRASEINAPKGTAILFKVLREKYGFKPEDVQWWATHAEADVGHSSIAIDVYRKYVRSEAEQEMVLGALVRMMAAWNVFYDGLLLVAQQRPEEGASHVKS